ncbi:hypothetical protein DFH28DRAFT_926899 [Melampsora americana]|nr:hypothetical protein DFH28DRAFT_926899 [Melampsora americana]
MAGTSRARPYSRPGRQSPSPPGRPTRSASTSQGRRARSAGTNRDASQPSSSQPAELSSQQTPGSRIQMMLNRSRGTSNASSGGSSDPTPDPCRPAISSDLDQFNFETSDANDLQLQVQINNALQEQAALAGTATASQADTGPPHSNSGPTPTHLTGTRLALFNRLAARSRLDEQSLSLGRFLCNVEGRDDQFLSCVVGILVVQQEVDSVRMELLEAIKQITSARPGVSPDGATWKADSAKLKQTIRLLATQCILGGDVQAYHCGH